MQVSKLIFYNKIGFHGPQIKIEIPLQLCLTIYCLCTTTPFTILNPFSVITSWHNHFCKHCHEEYYPFTTWREIMIPLKQRQKEFHGPTWLIMTIQKPTFVMIKSFYFNQPNTVQKMIAVCFAKKNEQSEPKFTLKLWQMVWSQKKQI